MKLAVQGIQKSFSGKRILKDISFEISQGQSLAFTGHNGSGKTTLIRILCALSRQDKGEIVFSKNDKTIKPEFFKDHFSLVGPYLQLYEELTAFENLKFLARLKSIKNGDDSAFSLINQVGLKGRAHDPVKTYSSGMKQRLKYAFALLSSPDVLFLDEPTSNLDKDGINKVYEIMKNQKQEKILIFATNDENDLKLADQVVQVDA
ncbi:MAG: ABC transporter ATP-binding protein [Calditrichaeota bacterium]|nr:MAG: ABC transporter ATP-binding protein [Calditrichota bacterium]MBL1206914.1 ABC transporter ATP-binding protein [Calditrichota bacterium]NOG46741.1 ABC transporter ATP-binding protein [Calditrichota bacterium]